jgi:peptide/nickel transport system permease protein
MTAGNAKTVSLETLSQWQLMGRRFRRHRVAAWSGYILIVLYLIAGFAEFVAVYPATWRDVDFAYCPPQLPRWSPGKGLHVHPVRPHLDPVTFQRSYVEDRETVVPLRFFARGEPYTFWGIFPAQRRLLAPVANPGMDPEDRPTFFLLGADKYGRDLFSRIVHGSRISLSVGLVGIAITFVLGLFIGGVSGYAGGALDTFIQRAIEVISSFPQLPLWLALAAVMPPDWSPLHVYFGITVVLSLLGWTGLARVVRGKLLALREEDYVIAARLLGAGHARIIARHLLPGFSSHIIVTLTLSVPGMILGETALSFLGLGLRPPVVSWGVLLQDCMNMTTVSTYPWLLMPVFFVVMTVLCFNFFGDGLRDAADPYASR